MTAPNAPSVHVRDMHGARHDRMPRGSRPGCHPDGFLRTLAVAIRAAECDAPEGAC